MRSCDRAYRPPVASGPDQSPSCRAPCNYFGTFTKGPEGTVVPSVPPDRNDVYDAVTPIRRGEGLLPKEIPPRREEEM